MSSSNNNSNNNNNNNNNGRSHNRYIVPAASPSAAKPNPIPIGGYQHFAAPATHNSGRKAPIHRATAPVARVSPPVAPSNIPSAGASDSSYNSAPAERTSGYICRGWIVPLPKADKLRPLLMALLVRALCARTPQRSKDLELASRLETTHPS
jgi:hypothetical protein